MKYNTAWDFWRDLKAQFGPSAAAVAIEYLDTVTAQSRHKGEDPEELAFCKDLYSALSAEA